MRPPAQHQAHRGHALDRPLSDLFAQIVDEYRGHGLVTRFVLVAEVVDDHEERHLHVHAQSLGGGSPPHWDVLGMLEVGAGMVRYDDDDED